MSIGPLEYVVIGFQNYQFTSEVLPVLSAIQQNGALRVVDLLFVSKDADGTVTMQEVSELSDEDLTAYEGLAGDLMGLLTAEDIKRLAGEIPLNTSTVIVLLEHTWAIELAEAVHRAGGVLFTGGVVTPEALKQVSAELAAAKEENHA